ncbi:HEAT repeat domain-containing protein [Myroides sp. TSA_177.3]|uniref:HEAT repeat domain-containing protein n=1 Tax=Myroides sp. TSA_177.3 TaxID=3415650 RepID=UPI004046273F
MEIQLSRIKEKLANIEQYDEDFVVFGADSHEYKVGASVNLQEVTTFEQKCGIKLPEAYVAFVTQIGNGNTTENAYMGSAAGPYYGIYPLGDGLEDLNAGDVKRYLSYPCLLDPDMTDKTWTTLTQAMYDEELSDEAYDAIVGPLFGGLLPIGTQGCAITTCLILNGPHKGRIVYLNDDYKPAFAYEADFLAWYERWLDEIIAGDLLAEQAGWFGYRRGGTSIDLWEAFRTATTEQEQLEYLDGLISKKEISEPILQGVIETIPQVTIVVRKRLISILAKTAFNRAIPFLEEEVEANLLFVLQQIHWYGTNEAYWLPVLEAYKDKIEEEETYRFYSYIAIKATDNYAYLIVHGLTSRQAEIRSQAIYTLGKLENKEAYIVSFKEALQDENENVVLYSLQALRGIIDESLLPVYQAVYHKYKDSEEENYILTNLTHRLTEMKLTVEDLQA